MPIALRRFLALLPLLTIAAGCGDGSPIDERVGEAEQAVQVCPWGPTVPGIDVSYYQDTIDWGAVAASGMTFAIARINDGNYMDPQFGANWAGIQAVGMIRGAYQFYEPTMDAVAQANIAVAAVGVLGPGDLPVTLDVEWTSGTPNAGAIQTWVDIVTAGTGKRPMIYTALGYWNQYFNGELGQVDLWVANWDIDCPNLPSSWTGWIFWQWGGAGVPGIAGNVDQDVFNGSLEDLKALASADGSQNCRSSAAAACGHYGCHCVDDQCNGGFCPGTGCTAGHTNDCGAYGCGCVDGQCNGVYCNGTGCTAKEALDCGGYGCNCVDHACAGGACAGSGCTARETDDCGKYGCGCVDHACAGGACPGTGCTLKQDLDCDAQSSDCSLGACVPPPSSGEGGATGASAGVGAGASGGGGPDTEPPVVADGPGGSAASPPEAGESSGCATGHGDASAPAWLAIAALAHVVLRRRRRAV